MTDSEQPSDRPANANEAIPEPESVEQEEATSTRADAQPVPPREESLYQESLRNALIAVQCADDLRGRDIVLLDMTPLMAIVDFFIIVSGTSRRQIHAIADEVNRKLKGEEGLTRRGVEGYRTEGNWVLTDFGDVVLHVFTQEGRDLYNLEQLWADAPRIDWENHPVYQQLQAGRAHRAAPPS